MPTLTVTYSSAEEFLSAFDAEISKAGLLVRGATLENTPAGSLCVVFVQVGGQPKVEVAGKVAAVVPGVGVAVMFNGVPGALAGLAQQLRSAPAAPAPAAADEPGEEPEAPRGSLFERLKTMTIPEKTQLALSGTREERAALLRDNAKTIHIFVLKNPRIGIDEIQYAAKLPSLAPDALKMIAEHRDWSGNATVCTALVRNPKTPLPLALRLLDRVPQSDLRALAKGGARDQIVHAARKKVSG
ncbi:MAG: hypothetical protein ACYC8T_22880 [Myxococcaceae bacterium]